MTVTTPQTVIVSAVRRRHIPFSVLMGLGLAFLIVCAALMSFYIAPFDPMRMAAGPATCSTVDPILVRHR